MTLENINGNLLVYKELEPGTFQHADQITTERRTNHGLRNQRFYTADGELYTVQKGKCLWAITREPQNLILQNIDEAYRQLKGQENYFPDVETAKVSLNHSETVIVDIMGLELQKDSDEYGHFVINPRKISRSNSEQRKTAQRIYGPDEEDFGLNMEMFAEAGANPHVLVLIPNYVKGNLKNKGQEFLGRASWLGNFGDDSSFCADDRRVVNHYALRGVRRIAEGDAPEKGVPRETERVKTPTIEEILTASRVHVSESGWNKFQEDIGKLYK